MLGFLYLLAVLILLLAAVFNLVIGHWGWVAIDLLFAFLNLLCYAAWRQKR